MKARAQYSGFICPCDMTKKILVVDDEEIVRNYVVRALLSRGYAVETATNGVSALDMAQKEKFDLVICDLKMG